MQKENKQPAKKAVAATAMLIALLAAIRLPAQQKPTNDDCLTCHADPSLTKDVNGKPESLQVDPEKFKHSVHGEMFSCVDCHTDVTSSPHENTPAKISCANCHADEESAWERSFHAKSQQNGGTGATCVDCHGRHDVLPPIDPKSSIFKLNIPNTCAKCHASVAQEFNHSIHGQAIARGNWQAPVCTDCHGIHSIKSHKDPNSPVAAQNLATNTCARCHEGVQLSQEFGFEGTRVSTYLASYHGLAAQRGSTVVANCASCHGVHNILPSSDLHSSVHPANLIKTCGQCHRGVTANFVAAKVHVNAPTGSDTGSIVVRWVRSFYLLLIVAVIGAMLLHNLIIWRFKAIALHRQLGRQTVTRMSRGQRIQHALLFTSFFVLVFTGFTLKYPDSAFRYLALGMNENLRGLTHRLAGLVLIGIGSYHLFYAIFQTEGRRMLQDIFPHWQDLRDTWENLAYHLGLASAKPQFGRFSYAEKIEYWALVWGTIIMAVTGVMLWAKVTVGNHLPRWWIDVATAVHFYEAILATLAILVWHFYQVFLDPDTYPMNWAWWDGKVPMHHYRDEHPLDIETLAEHQEPDGASEDPFREKKDGE